MNYNLSNREKQVLEMISNGLNYREISNALFISLNTVMSHRKNIKEKLGVKNSAGLVRVGFEKGYLQIYAN